MEIFLFCFGSKPYFLYESSSWVKIRLPAENRLPGYPGSGLKVSVWAGGWVTDQLHCHSNLSCVGLSWGVTKSTQNQFKVRPPEVTD